MCPDYSGIDRLFTQEAMDQFMKRIHKFDSPLHEKICPTPNMRSERMSFPVMPQDNGQELLKEINSKLDQIIAHIGVPSAYIFTGKDVLDEFKKLNGVK